MDNEIVLWDSQSTEIVPSNLTSHIEITQFARQLTSREKQQIIAAYNSQSYEMATSYVWNKSMASLKRELSKLGVTFLGEMLDRSDIDEDDTATDVISDREAIKIAEELGMISRTTAIKMKHYHELTSHFMQRDSQEDDEEMTKIDALSILHSCVTSVLSRERIQVAQNFADLRDSLETESLQPSDPRIQIIQDYPYFFKRVIVNVLVSGVKVLNGAKLEHCLSNVNVILPMIWSDLRDADKWKIGSTYSEVYSAGLSIPTSGLKQALLKVKGFDWVPENLRSHTFKKIANDIIMAHEEFGNFENEVTPTMLFSKLGSVIPAAAFGTSMTALLCVSLGNFYGASFRAKPISDDILKNIGITRWSTYFDKFLNTDIKILEKLQQERPRNNWIELIKIVVPQELPDVKGKVRDLLSASHKSKARRIEDASRAIIDEYYGLSKK